MANFAATIKRRKTGTYVVTRAAEGSRTKGRFVAGSTSTLNVDAVVQPMSGMEMQELPEGMRTDETIRIYSATELYTDAGGTRDPDLFAYNGNSYEVKIVNRWSEAGGYWKVIAQKKGR